jgi:hypothetical protein
MESVAFERGVGPVLQIFLPEKAEAVAHFQADAALQDRIEELATRSTEGQLTEAESEEYAGYVRANKFVAFLQRHARNLIETPPKRGALTSEAASV